jgi:hypothetical protein
LDGLDEGVVDLKDGFLEAVVAVVFGFVFSFHDGKESIVRLTV